MSIKVNRSIYPHFLKVSGNEIEIFNKNGLPITETLKIKKLGDRKLSQLAYSREGIVRSEAGVITGVYMYGLDSQTETPNYQFRLKLIGNLNVKQI